MLRAWGGTGLRVSTAVCCGAPWLGSRLGRPRQMSSGPGRGTQLDSALENVIEEFKQKKNKSSNDYLPLQERQVKKVLLCCNDYDTYTFNEEVT